MKPTFPILMATLWAAACAPVAKPAPTPEIAPSLASCGGDRYLDQIGSPLETLRAPIGSSARIHEGSIEPDAVSQPSRLNFAIDTNRNLSRVWCG